MARNFRSRRATNPAERCQHRLYVVLDGGEVQGLEPLGVVKTCAERVRLGRISAQRRKIELLRPPKLIGVGRAFGPRGSRSTNRHGGDRRQERTLPFTLHPVSSDASLSRDSSSYGPGSDVSLPGSFDVSDKATLSRGAPPEGTKRRGATGDLVPTDEIGKLPVIRAHFSRRSAQTRDGRDSMPRTPRAADAVPRSSARCRRTGFVEWLAGFDQDEARNA